MKLHDGEVEIDARLVGRLVDDQFPRLAGLPVTEVQSTGTVNAIYRLSDHAGAGHWASSMPARARRSPPNLLVRGGRLSAVIDFGAVGVGDPATDVIAAWSVFGPAGRETFRSALGVDDGTWERARGIALHQAALIIPYYAETNHGFVALARRTVEEVLAGNGA